MRNKAINALLELGIPANTKGFLYITDAMEAIDENKGLQYKTYQLYEEIAKKYEGVTASKVERAIRHAFSEATAYKNVEPIQRSRIGNILLKCLEMQVETVASISIIKIS